VTNVESQVYCTIYTVLNVEDEETIQDLNDNEKTGLRKIGYVLIPISAVSHQKPIDQSFKLRGPDVDPEVGSPQLSLSSHRQVHIPEIHLKIQYTVTQHKLVGLNDFQLLRTVGRGAFGKVMMVKKKDSCRLYAMKVMSKEYIVNGCSGTYLVGKKCAEEAEEPVRGVAEVFISDRGQIVYGHGLRVRGGVILPLV